MLNERDKSILKHILEYCDKIERAIARFGITLDILKTDEDYRNIVSMYVFQIGELTTHFSKKFLLANTEMPWSKMKGMRNIAAHNYKNFSMDLLYGVLIENIPELKGYCLKKLNEEM